MKNKHQLIALFHVFMLTSWTTTAQLNLNGITMNGGYFGYFSNTSINVACTSPVNLTIGTKSYDLLAKEAITFCPDFSVSAVNPGSTSFLLATIGNQQLAATILEPSDPNAVPQYEKLEMGITLPQFNTRISAFINNTTGAYKPGTTAYNTAITSGAIMNPYDPDNISVDAVFFRPGSPNMDGIIKHGFYYKKYNDSGSKNWSLDNTNPYEWRVRFAPDEVGQWSGYILIYVNGVLQPQNYFFDFTVVNSSNKGFVKVAPNKQYLQYDNGESFFPIGDNFTWPTYGTYTEGGQWTCLTANCANLHDARINRTYRTMYDNYLDMLSQNNTGGNMTRFIMAAWGLEMEREKLNNYDTRQIEMFELDNMFKNAEKKGVKLTMATLLSGGLEPKPNFGNLPLYSSCWEANPYNNTSYDVTFINDPMKAFKGIQGVDDAFDFFTNPTAKQMYKRKLRYICARWGYSTSFAIHELLTEVDGTMPDYWSNPANNVNVEAWLNEMAGFIKQELREKQLITLTYMGDGYASSPANQSAITIWNKPDIDLISGHNYFTRLDGFRMKAKDTKDISAKYKKPAIFNENDVNHFFWTNAIGPEAFHNTLWSSAFSGAFGAGGCWEHRRYAIPDWHNAPGMDVEKEYKGLRNFFADIDLVNYSYSPYASAKVSSLFTLQSSPFENFYLVRKDKNYAYGWVHNRSFNHFSHPGNCAYVDTDNSDFFTQPNLTVKQMLDNDVYMRDSFDPLSLDDEAYRGFFPISPSGWPILQYPRMSGEFQLNGLTPNASYQIKYYRTTGTNAGVYVPAYDNQFTTNAGGSCYIGNAPPTDSNNPDWAYKIKKLSDKQRTLNLADEEVSIIRGLTVMPNPSSGLFKLSGDILTDATSITVFDIYGRVVLSAPVAKRNWLEIDLSNQANGMYLIQVQSGKAIFTKRIVKE